ncbi:MAG: hypothetical protein PVI20_13515 [Desulfobacteraceae bacterium]|jgi:hypothetical protein
MDQVIRALVDRLLDKGMQIDAIPAFIRNALNAVAAKRFITLEELKEEMQSLGWHEFELDDHTYQLILATIEPDSEYDSTPIFAGKINYDARNKQDNRIRDKQD